MNFFGFLTPFFTHIDFVIFPSIFASFIVIWGVYSLKRLLDV